MSAEWLFDPMYAVVISGRRGAGGRRIENPELRGFSDHWVFRDRASRPYRARTRGKVERPIRHLRGSFLDGREFVNEDDLNAPAWHWLDEVGNVRMHGTLKERIGGRFARERPLLGPPAARPYTPVVPRSEPQEGPRSGERSLPRGLRCSGGL